MTAARILAAAAAAVGLMLVAYLDASGSWRLPIPIDRANQGWLVHFALLIAAPVGTALFAFWAGRRAALATTAIGGLAVAALIGWASLPAGSASCGPTLGTVVVIVSGAAMYVVPAIAGIAISGPAESRPWPLVIGVTAAVGLASILFFLFVGASFGPICPTPRA